MVFSGQVGEWGSAPFDDYRDLQRLELWPGLGFDPLRLVGHVPNAICFHGSLEEAGNLFEDLLRGSRAPTVLTADGARVVGGRCPSPSKPTSPDRHMMTCPDLCERKDATIRFVNLSGLMPGSLHSTLAHCIWVEAVALPTWSRELPGVFFANCRSLRSVNLEECGQLRKIGHSCFEGCASLRSLSFTDALSSVDEWAFASSGLEALDFAHAKGLVATSICRAYWLRSLRLPFRSLDHLHSGSACRLLDVSGGFRDEPKLEARLRHFRSSAMRGSGGKPWRCLAAARITAELVAVGQRSGIPALPC
jgi:hypothetical protein